MITQPYCIRLTNRKLRWDRMDEHSTMELTASKLESVTIYSKINCLNQAMVIVIDDDHPNVSKTHQLCTVLFLQRILRTVNYCLFDCVLTV